jgi:hypothetical protein
MSDTKQTTTYILEVNETITDLNDRKENVNDTNETETETDLVYVSNMNDETTTSRNEMKETITVLSDTHDEDTTVLTGVKTTTTNPEDIQQEPTIDRAVIATDLTEGKETESEFTLHTKEPRSDERVVKEETTDAGMTKVEEDLIIITTETKTEETEMDTDTTRLKQMEDLCVTNDHQEYLSNTACSSDTVTSYDSLQSETKTRSIAIVESSDDSTFESKEESFLPRSILLSSALRSYCSAKKTKTVRWIDDDDNNDIMDDKFDASIVQRRSLVTINPFPVWWEPSMSAKLTREEKRKKRKSKKSKTSVERNRIVL